MTTDLKTNISGAVGLALVLLKHFGGPEIPDWIANDIIVPLIVAAAGHVVYNVGKPVPPAPAEPSAPNPNLNPVEN